MKDPVVSLTMETEHHVAALERHAEHEYGMGLNSYAHSVYIRCWSCFAVASVISPGDCIQDMFQQGWRFHGMPLCPTCCEIMNLDASLFQRGKYMALACGRCFNVDVADDGSAAFRAGWSYDNGPVCPGCCEGVK